MRGLASGLVAALLGCALLVPMPGAAGRGAGGEAAVGPGAGGGFGRHSLQPIGQTASADCNFCHTPQGARGAVPRWAAAREPAEFEAYDKNGESGGISVRGSDSAACLACHDGGQAPDVWAEIGLPAAPGGFGGRLRAGDHPVGIVFSGFEKPDDPASGGWGRLQQDTVGAQVAWWVDLEAVPNGIRDKTDVILYTRGQGAAAQPFIECASCHDPHGAPGGTFLRSPSAGSRLCFACHNI